MRACGNCTFWERFSDAEGELNYGECRRYPPTQPVGSKDPIIISLNMGEKTKTTYQTCNWNIQTGLYDWCGEFMTTTELLHKKSK